MKRLAGIAVAVWSCSLVAGCVADVAGAPCETQDTCPLGQVCTAAKRCALVESFTGSGGHRRPSTALEGLSDADDASRRPRTRSGPGGSRAVAGIRIKDAQ